MKIKKGDQVLITKGKDRGRTGKVLKAFPLKANLLVEGVNLKKKHIRPKKSGEKGQIVKKPGAINISSVKFLCSKCKKTARIGYRIEKDKKYRICKKCKAEV